MSGINANWPSGIIYLNRSHIWFANIFLGTLASVFKRDHSITFPSCNVCDRQRKITPNGIIRQGKLSLFKATVIGKIELDSTEIKGGRISKHWVN